MRTDRYVEMATRRYDLDETQAAMVRGEIEQMEAQRRAAMGADASEYDRLQEEMFTIWNQNRADGAVTPAGPERWRGLRNDPRFADIRARMREIERKYPADVDTVLKRVESLLPPEKIERARQRRIERDAARAAARRRRMAREADPGADSAAAAGDTAATPENAGPGRLTPTKPLQPEAPGMPVVPPIEPAAADPPAAAVQGHPWEQYVKRFIADRGLSGAQSNAALAILKDARFRAGQIEKASADRWTVARQIPDRAAREKRLAELNQPIDQVFEELKLRLDSLLTAAQRAKARP
jgi:hypothetical protein